MSRAARRNGCSFIPFDQGRLIDKAPAYIPPPGGGDGICYGLAVAWLEASLKNTSFNFTANARNYMGSNVFARAHLFWCNQRNSQMWKDLTGLSYLDDKVVYDMRALTRFVGGALRKRYCLIKLPGHSMAAWGSIPSGVTFFDSNSGIVYSANKESIAQCLHEYFYAPTLQTLYNQLPQDKVTFLIERFK